MRRPRISSQASKPAITLPISVRTLRSSSQSASRRARLSTPAVRSEWPPRYLVPEWKAMSAPSASARSVQGGAAVQSAASSAPASCAASAAAATSITSQVGLVGVSIQSSRVAPGRSAAASPPGSVASKRLEPDAAALGQPAQPGEAAVVHRPAARRRGRRRAASRSAPPAPPCRWRRPGCRRRRRDRPGPPRRARPSGRRRGRRCSSAAAHRPRRGRRCWRARSPASPPRCAGRCGAAPARRGWRGRATSWRGVVMGDRMVDGRAVLGKRARAAVSRRARAPVRRAGRSGRRPERR